MAHWIEHLTASVRNFSIPCAHQELIDSVDDFIAKYWNDKFKSKPCIPKQVKTAFRALEGRHFYDQLLQVYHFKSADAPITESTVNHLELHKIVQRIRLVFETVVLQLPLRDSAEGMQLREYYGTNWFKCLRSACRRFYNGFLSAHERDVHEKRHSRPFRCDVAGSFAATIGCSTEQGLKKHKGKYHSSVDSFFPTY